MKQAVVGVFYRLSAAQHAAALLKGRGIDPHCIHVEGAQGEADNVDPQRSGQGRLLARVREFFADVTDDDDQTLVRAYSDAVRRGGTMVGVDVEDGPETDAAREVLTNAGAMDIDEKTAEGKRDGHPAANEDALDSSSRRPPATVRKASDLERGEDVIPVLREELRTSQRQVGGVRVFARTAAAPGEEQPQPGAERPRAYENFEHEYRNHMQGSPSMLGRRYEEYEPAYRFGHSIRQDARYTGKSWDGIEAQAQQAWSERYPDRPWERFRHAVRHAWESATG